MATRKSAVIDKDIFRQKLSRYTRQAYYLVPRIVTPSILDIGCGTGIPTIELAILSSGNITAADIDSAALKKLREKIKVLQLKRHIKPVKASLFSLRFRKESFDMIWSEGSISVIGFREGLKAWHRLIKPGGYLVVHDEIKEYKQKMNDISRLNYVLMEHFIISEHVWLHDYFRPLEVRIKELKAVYKNDSGMMKLLDHEACEIEVFRESPGDFASVFYIMQRK
ncbi:MAG: class I SAM-dependent methyltransferase [Spirochaetales bacterium]|nr:class I SAM-dependent methyltransferase [Spirochaetales bacterium]